MFPRAKNGQALLCDHLFFIRSDDMKGNAACRGADRGRVVLIGRTVQLYAQPQKLVCNTPADLRLVLANAGGEDEAVEPTERGCKPPDLAGDPEREEIDCLRASSLSFSRSSRVSPLRPETPSRPDLW